MKEPKMSDVCANCRMRYGRHQLLGDWCPQRGKPAGEYATTRWKRREPLPQPHTSGEKNG